MNFFSVLGLILITLKLMGTITISWFWVISIPFIGLLLASLVIAGLKVLVISLEQK